MQRLFFQLTAAALCLLVLVPGSGEASRRKKGSRLHAVHQRVEAPSLLQELGVKKHHLQVNYIKGSGPGGMKINNTRSTVQIIHKKTGLSVTVQEERFQKHNKKVAYERLGETLQNFLNVGGRLDKPAVQQKLKRSSQNKKKKRKRNGSKKRR